VALTGVMSEKDAVKTVNRAVFEIMAMTVFEEGKIQFRMEDARFVEEVERGCVAEGIFNVFRFATLTSSPE
jgi:hypothetical protein